MYSSAFGRRVQRILQSYSRETLLLWTGGTAYTVAQGSARLQFGVSPNEAKPVVYQPNRVWLDDVPLYRERSVEALTAWYNPNGSPQGAARAWAHVAETEIRFDVVFESQRDDVVVQGFYLHPAFTSDAQTVSMPEHELLLFDEYAQSFLRKDSASDEIGLRRLAERSRGAAAAIARLRGERMALHYQAGERGEYR